MGDNKERLEYLRGELRAGRISYEEIAELQGLAAEIDPGDVELLEAAGVAEGEIPFLYLPGEDHIDSVTTFNELLTMLDSRNDVIRKLRRENFKLSQKVESNQDIWDAIVEML